MDHHDMRVTAGAQLVKTINRYRQRATEELEALRWDHAVAQTHIEEMRATIASQRATIDRHAAITGRYNAAVADLRKLIAQAMDDASGVELGTLQRLLEAMDPAETPACRSRRTPSGRPCMMHDGHDGEHLELEEPHHATT